MADANRDPAGRFVKGHHDPNSLAYHAERINTEGWDSSKVPSIQYRRFFNMDRNDFIKLGKCFRIIELDKNADGTPAESYKDYPYKEHTMVEELTFLAVMRARNEIAYLKETTDRVEGKALEKVEAKVDTRLASMSDDELKALARAEFGEGMTPENAQKGA